MSVKITIDLADATRPVYRQIADVIRVWLVNGELAPGDLLPTVRELAAELGVHHNTVAEAYRRLAAEGWLDLGRRRGATVIEKDAAPQPRPQSKKKFFLRLEQLLAQGQADGFTAEEMMKMAGKILG
ncbi:GntR family transcriptional regulator [bacterium]|nr:GntR family transcriptional regulator [bacterium]